MISLKADNRQLTQGAKYSYLDDNYLSGVTSLIVDNAAGFAIDDYILLGNFGSETSEVALISNVTGNTLTVAATSFAHAESTKVTIIKYNRVIFYRTTTATFDSSVSNRLTGATGIVLQPDSFHTIYQDTTNTTGYGWFVYYNETTAKASSNSNAIPYAGFGENSAKKILDQFFSLLNNKELKLITNDDAFSWLNEAYNKSRIELNLTNEEYSVPTSETISVTSGTSEYDLPDNFSKVISVFSEDDDVYIGKIDLSDVDLYDENSGNTILYYVRGTDNQIGFSPCPINSGDYTLKYKVNVSTLTSYYDNINLPDNNYHFLKDYMLYRAAPKLQRVDGEASYKKWMDGLKLLKVSAHKRDDAPDSWGRGAGTNV